MSDRTIPPEDCPLLASAREVAYSARDLVQAMRRFWRNLRACEKCLNHGDCLILQDVHLQIDLAIQDVIEEWGLV